MSRPTIARVHGSAYGGGVGLAAACDICISTQDANFALSEVRLGLIPAVVCPYVMRAIGVRQSLRYMQSAERIPAARATEIGLVHETVAPDRLDARILEICNALVAGGPQSIAAAKALIFTLDNPASAQEFQEITARAIAQQRCTEEAKEGISAFLSKRAPNWPIRA
jgi:methylglutaconyl-CoA hydratase